MSKETALYLGSILASTLNLVACGMALYHGNYAFAVMHLCFGIYFMPDNIRKF